MTRARWLLAVAALAACQGEGREPKPSGEGGGKAPSGSAAPAREGSAGDGASAQPPRPPPAPQTSAQIIAKLGALPVWEGVVQRGQYLERRGQRGALYGRVGDEVEGEDGRAVWLIDDTEGEGSLAVRAVFADSVPPKGSRVVATGAWTFPELPSAPAAPSPPPAAPSSPAAPSPPPAAAAPAAPAPPAPTPRWVWKVERVTPLPEETTFAPTSPIGHEIKAGPRPAEAVPISKAKDNDVVVFQVLSAPRRLGEAWLVADQLGSPPIAMLSMPGDRASYGGIDFRQPDEQWRLRRGVTYVVRIGKIRRKDPSKPATINARNAPIKL